MSGIKCRVWRLEIVSLLGRVVDVGVGCCGHFVAQSVHESAQIGLAEHGVLQIQISSLCSRINELSNERT